MRYITAVVLFTIGATVQALPVPVFPGSVGLLPRQSNGEGLPELLDTTIADLLHAKSLAALVENQSTNRRSAVMSKLPLAGDIKEARDLVDIDVDVGDPGFDLDVRHLDSNQPIHKRSALLSDVSSAGDSKDFLDSLLTKYEQDIVRDLVKDPILI